MQQLCLYEMDYTKEMPSRTWWRITLSDDFKLCGGVVLTTSMQVVMQVTLLGIKPIINSNTTVTNAFIEALLLWSHPDLLTVYSLHSRMHNPARWTADSCRWCCCRTRHGQIVI